MLLCQNFRRRHQCDLVTIFNGDDRRLESDNRLARSHVALQQSPHGARHLHVGGDFFQDFFLRRRRMKWQYFLNRLSNAAVKPKRDSRLCLPLATLEFEAKLDEKELVEDHSYVRWRARRLQIAEA